MKIDRIKSDVEQANSRDISNLSQDEREKIAVLEKENEYLKCWVDVYRSMKRVRFVDKVIKTVYYYKPHSVYKPHSKVLKRKNPIVALKKENRYLKALVDAYKSRKVVRYVERILGIYPFPKLGVNPYPEPDLICLPRREINSVALPTRTWQLKKLKDIKVAVILDEFSYNSFKYEFDAVVLEPSNWLEILETEKPDLFLCESAWSGGPWKGEIHHHINTRRENRGKLLAILQYCREHSIPTIFWNKEDPTNFEYFFETALRFDHIFTTAEECVSRYRNEFGHQSVHYLMFAAQPKLFNPIEEHERSEDVIFAGGWYTHHEKRSEEMAEILDSIIDSGLKLKIYDRYYELCKEYPRYRFPDKYQEFTNSPVPHNQINVVYKESKYGLNINTVTESKTMFARRALELMLCNTLVLSNYSEGLYQLFRDNVIWVGKDKINLSNSPDKRINNLYNVLENHSYYNRFKQILDDIDYEYLPDDNRITFYYLINTPSDIEDVIGHYESMNYNYKELALVLSSQIPDNLVKNVYQRYSNDEISVYSLKYLLNQHEGNANYLHKLWSFHGGYLQKADEKLSSSTPYFIIADENLDEDFAKKAFLHYSYIERDTGIALGDKFAFKEVKDVKNVLFYKENFDKVFKHNFKDNSVGFPVYIIQI